MALPAEKLPFTRVAYLAAEALAPTRSSFHAGEVFSMAGGTPVHAVVTANATRVLGNAIAAAPCLIGSPDLRIHINAEHLTYADVVVLCPPVTFAEDDTNSVTNPTVIVEVLSPGTAAWDRGGKFALYRTMPSLQHYLIIAQDCWRIEHFRRLGDGSWRLTEHGPGGTVDLDAVGARIAVDEVYAKVDLVGGPTRDAQPSDRPPLEP